MITAAVLRRAGHVVERNVVIYRRGWFVFASGFMEPFFYLLSIGLGLSALVGPLGVGGGRTVGYAMFVAPGLLASQAMNGALFDATFNLFYKLKIAHTYDAMLSTPLGVGDVAAGELAWALVRAALYSAAFLAVMAGLGDAAGPWAVACLPAAVLVSFAFGSAGMAATTFLRSWNDFDLVSLALIPMFLFSATFYPLTVYPGWLQALVLVTPLYQGVVLLRAIDLGQWGWGLASHAAYLALLGTAGLALTAWRMRRMLLP